MFLNNQNNNMINQNINANNANNQNNNSLNFINKKKNPHSFHHNQSS